MKKISSIFLVIFIMLFSQSIFAKKLKIVTTLPFLKSITQSITQDRAIVYSIAKGIEDPHHVEVKPSDMLKLNRADMLIVVGMDLDLWTAKLMTGARNPKIYVGANGYVDASIGVNRLEIPQVKIDPSMGDIHIYGNPHYQTDPENGKIMAKNILDGLLKVDPKNAEYYKDNYNSFIQRLNTKIEEWQNEMNKFKGTRIIVYHDQWIYFAKRFGLTIIGSIELKPGIPPTAKHLEQLIDEINYNKIKVVIMAPYLNKKIANYISQKTGAKVLIFAHDVGAVKEADSYIDMIEYNVKTLINALSK